MFAVDSYETKQAIEKGLNSMEFASLPSIMKTAQDLTKKTETLTNYELCSLVNKDPFMLAKIMDRANRGGKSGKVQVSKVEDAVLKVGFSNVKNMAFSLLDMEAAKAKLRYHEQGETAGMSLCSCIVAEKIMNEVGRLDPQEVYTVTILRSYGEQLMSAFMIHYYREALAQIPEKGEDAAFRAVFGTTPIELTHELLKETKLPKEFLRCLKKFDPETLELEFISEVDELIIYSEYAQQLTKLIFNYELGEEEFNQEALNLLEFFKRKVWLREEQMFRIVMELGDVISEYKTKYKIEPLLKGMDQTLSARIKHIEPPPPPPKEPDPDEPSDIDHKTHKNPELILSDSAREIAWFASKRPPEMEEIHQSVLKGFYQGLGLDHVIVFVRDSKENPVFRPFTGQGDMYDSIKSKVTLEETTKDLFGICLQRKLNALVYDTGERSIQPLLPSWLRQFNVNSLLMLTLWDDSPDLGKEESSEEDELPEAAQYTPPEEEEPERDRTPFMIIFCANNNGQRAIQLKNTMAKSIVGIKRQLIKACLGQSINPLFQQQERKPEEELELGEFMRQARKTLIAKRRKKSDAGGMNF